MKSIVVLGAGMVGSAIARDLCPQYSVQVADIDKHALQKLDRDNSLETKQADLSREDEVTKLVDGADLVICAVPGPIGFSVLGTIIQAGVDVVDISFFPEDPFELDDLAKRHNVTAIVDCGVAPGMCNVLLGYHAEQMQVTSYECLVGGLPAKRSLPYQYKAPFSPIDVIAEYTREARIKESGKMLTKKALSDREYVDIEPVGTLEAFNTDGLRTLLNTMDVPTMIEKTLRYPGHIDHIELLRETGFLSEKEITVNGQTIRPIDLTTKLLFPLWKLEEDEHEFTVMRVTIKGKLGSKNKTIVYDLFDEYDEETNTSSMARTTGYTCTAAANLVLDGQFEQVGICPPEYIGKDKQCVESMLAYLGKRGIDYARTTL